MPPETPSFEHQEIPNWSYKDFLNRLKATVNNVPLPAPEKMPRQIDIGRFGDVARDMIVTAQSNGHKGEWIRLIKSQTTPEGTKILIDKHNQLGDYVGMTEYEQKIPVDDGGRPTAKIKPLGLIHTHPTDSPFSPMDTINLEHEFEMLVLVTDELISLLLRTSKTIIRPNVDLSAKMESFQGSLSKGEQIIREFHEKSRGDAAQFNLWVYQWLKQECDRRGFAYYSAPLDREDNVLTKATA